MESGKHPIEAGITPAREPATASSGDTTGVTLPVIRFTTFDESLVVHGITTRTPGLPLHGNMSYMVGDDVDLVRHNREAWARAIGYDPNRLVLGRQVHETTITVVDESHAGSGAHSVETSIRRVDGLITRAPDLPIGVMAADCVPILMYDPVLGAVGAIHAGWRGTVDGIAARAVESMNAQFGSLAENLVVGLGPSICRSCYQVGPEVTERWQASGFASDVDATSTKSGGTYFDLRAANYAQLLMSGVRAETIEASDACTRCSNGALFSRRGLGPRTGLFTSVIMLRDGADKTTVGPG